MSYFQDIIIVALSIIIATLWHISGTITCIYKMMRKQLYGDNA